MTDRTAANDFASMFESSTAQVPSRDSRSRPLSLGEKCKAEVVQVGRDVVFVEILDHATLGKRPQAYIQVLDLRTPSGELSAKVGDVLEAVVVDIDRKSGEVRLGRSMGKPEGLAELENAYAAAVPVEGKVTDVNKGGLEVEVAGQRAFCPLSQIDRGMVSEPQSYVGRTLQFRVTELRDGGKRIVLSRRAVIEQERKQAAAQTLASLTVGAVMRGTVTSVRDFGAFVDLGGVEGLVPNAELSYDRAKKASDLLTAGDALDVQIREIKEGVVDKRGEPTTKITLSLKALAQDPWNDIAAHAPEGRVARGIVTRLLDFGAFIQLVPSVEGLLHVSELGGKVNHPSQVLKVGQALDVVVRSVDRSARKISLAPAAEGLSVGAQVGAPVLLVGAIVNGTVDRIETYGVFLQVEGTKGRVGRGLIPSAELGVPRGTDLRKQFPIGKALTAKVLETGDGKLRLSLKAIEEDQERADFDGFKQASAAAAKLGTFADLFKKS